MDANNVETQTLPEKDKIFCSRRFYYSCEIINGLLFLCAIALIAIGTYNLLIMNMIAKECSQRGINPCNHKSTSSRVTYPMIIIGCVLLVFCALLLVVMVLLARETVKYVRRFSAQLPTYDEAVNSISTSEASMDDVWSV